jgi:ABC-type multidrug transport system fused ATPase/permease subunit
LGVAAASWCLISLFALFAESISFKTKILYFEKCLEKDAAFYDKISPTEMASRISKECSAIARGLGEKVGNTITAVASFFFGFIFAFYWGWLLTCILLAGFPIIIATGVSLGVSLQSGFVEAMKSYS